MNEPATKQDIVDLRLEWRSEIVTQTRWLAALFVAGFLTQFFATMAGVWFMLSRLLP